MGSRESACKRRGPYSAQQEKAEWKCAVVAALAGTAMVLRIYCLPYRWAASAPAEGRLGVTLGPASFPRSDPAVCFVSRLFLSFQSGFDPIRVGLKGCSPQVLELILVFLGICREELIR